MMSKEKIEEEVDPSFRSSTSKFPYRGVGENVRDAHNDQLLKWFDESVSISLDLPLWRENVKAMKAAFALQVALVGGDNFSDINKLSARWTPKVVALADTRASNLHFKVVNDLF